jgi:hypothetical protein
MQCWGMGMVVTPVIPATVEAYVGWIWSKARTQARTWEITKSKQGVKGLGSRGVTQCVQTLVLPGKKKRERERKSEGKGKEM